MQTSKKICQTFEKNVKNLMSFWYLKQLYIKLKSLTLHSIKCLLVRDIKIVKLTETITFMFKILKVLGRPFESITFPYFLIISLISNSMILCVQPDLHMLLGVVSLSGLFAYVVSGMVRLCGSFIGSRRSIFLNPVFGLFCILTNILLLIDCFLYVQFHMILSQDVIDIIAETNPSESASFIDSYLSISSILLWMAIFIILNVGIYFLSRLIIAKAKKFCTVIGSILVVAGLWFFGSASVSFILYRNGYGMPQMTAITRVAYSYYIMRQSMGQINHLSDFTRQNINSTVTAGSGDDAIIVFVIGESHSTAHTSIYGYGLKTYPLIEEMVNNGELVAYSDVVTISDHTHGVMHSLFSMGDSKTDFASVPIFPSVFKAAGYRTILYDNQYLVGRGVSFLGSEDISKQNFDVRNTHEFMYDGMMIDSLPAVGQRTLVICHLMGQHYTYSDRFPARFGKFKQSDYGRYDRNYRQAIADYDNACLYNDFVLSSLIDKFRDKDAVVVYVSDHGEELYEDGKSVGHGFASSSRNIELQIKVPMFIWASKTYRETHPEKWTIINQHKNSPVFTDDISHALVDLSGIETVWLDPKRSFVNEKFDSKRPRIVLNSIDYDKR